MTSASTWLDSADIYEAATGTRVFWDRARGDLDAGTFWADRIQSMKGDPARLGERLRLAMSQLPLPAAFREAVLVLRAVIREKHGLGGHYESELQLLYWLAAIDSFSIPYSEVARMTGFSVLQSIPGSVIRGLEVDYKRLGYRKLKLLVVQDHKRLVAYFGEPDSHQSLHEVHIDVWKKHEALMASGASRPLLGS